MHPCKEMGRFFQKASSHGKSEPGLLLGLVLPSNSFVNQPATLDERAHLNRKLVSFRQQCLTSKLLDDYAVWLIDWR